MVNKGNEHQATEVVNLFEIVAQYLNKPYPWMVKKSRTIFNERQGL